MSNLSTKNIVPGSTSTLNVRPSVYYSTKNIVPGSTSTLNVRPSVTSSKLLTRALDPLNSRTWGMSVWGNFTWDTTEYSSAGEALSSLDTKEIS